MNHFVIMGAARTKSSYLEKLLDSHPNVVCHSELFHQKKMMSKLSNYNEQKFYLSWRNTNPVDFLKFIYEETAKTYPQINTIGCKLLLYAYQVNRGFEALMQFKPKVIFLNRKNKLAWYSSLKIAFQTNIWSTGSLSNKQHQTTFNQEDYEGLVETQLFIDNVTLSKLREHEINFIQLEYEEIGSPENIERMLNFLELPRADLNTTLVQQNSSDLLTRFTNPQEVVDFAVSIEKIEWLY